MAIAEKSHRRFALLPSNSDKKRRKEKRKKSLTRLRKYCSPEGYLSTFLHINIKGAQKKKKEKSEGKAFIISPSQLT